MKDTIYKSVFTAIDIYEKATKRLNDNNTGPQGLLKTIRLTEILVCTMLEVHNQFFQQKV